MSGTKIGLKLAGTALLAVFSLAAQAGDTERRGYVSAMAGKFLADDNRLADDGTGGALAFGIEASDLFNLELEFSGDGMDKDKAAGGSQNFNHFGAGVNGLLVFARDAVVSPFLLVGAGILNTDASTDKGASAMGQVGLGAFVNFTDNLALRVDGRYRADANDVRFYSQPKFEDYVAMLGVSWTFGEKPQPAAPAAAVAPVAEAKAAPSDSDNDGVNDDLDKCPGTPAAVKVDAATGCEPDSDGDGVADSADKCPDTKPGVKVDEAGCDLDSDGDGVTNDKDLCPDTPAGTKVNATGCEEQAGFVIKGINFATGSAKLTPASTAILDQVAEKLRANPGIKITVDGHTDDTGSKAGNTGLSKARAQAVVDYFVGKGVGKDSMVARGFGPDRPVADNKTAAGRAENRRVEINTVE